MMKDDLVVGFDRALRMLAGVPASARGIPGANLDDAVLTTAERRHAAGLMRVNHTGEVCAQALYAAQAVLAVDPRVRREFAVAAREEEEHLAWTQQRLAELDDRPSRLNPLWYAGSFAIGIAAGFAGDRVNLGFVVETERQVEEHLTAHMERLPEADAKSRAIVEKMRDDERATERRPGPPAPPTAIRGEKPDAGRGGCDAIRRLPRLGLRRLASRGRRRCRSGAARLASTRAGRQPCRANCQ
jgi:ubiquinone biosynthesis monooxygenase Coq7